MSSLAYILFVVLCFLRSGFGKLGAGLAPIFTGFTRSLGRWIALRFLGLSKKLTY